ncbi:ketoacyl-ACP synthase III [Weissella cibaria]|uniref:beta-ketoacyl-ACP synthase III n=1 Tax=Weissella TaxID=46255 RepID=UPI0002191B75|nr:MULTISPECIES: beta-ketoacyl-ACP synthase III [Weissella]APS27921.1 3-oxoacyl-[acyl-carrier-protein] synthase 3 [Weissella cibaria]APU63320.1 3-oxoacyl-[acyl-carrier-protein] synthase 3 [Weissella cibaria]APU65470.1 3-oxoacyl-[acyl-carrier-protein] synthase 3 [Weissella cibaria]ASS51153.1 3-oxoacyl-[acyl-carrier-protein] synthase 3 [Weissella cibaria]KXU04146.1 3-oxoacyl-(acyl-carrier-protein) synthase, KASIII [Weissella sp. DD23]
MERFTIVQSARVVPERVVTNDELATFMDTSDEWIQPRTGIRQRHIVSTEDTSDLAVGVATKLLNQAGLTADQLDFILVGTMSPDTLSPSVAQIVQGKIGATNAFAWDLSAACSGFVYTLSMASALLTTRYQRGLVIGAEVLSKLVDWDDRSTAVLFGDGAAGVLLERTGAETGLLAESLKTFGERSEFLTAGQQRNANYFAGELKAADPYFKMNGREVYNFATREVPAVLNEALAKASLTPDEIDYYLLHQANGRIVSSIAKRFGQPIEKFPTNMALYGNTSAASIGILLDELREAGTIKPGQTIAIAGFGGGLTVGALIIKV